jgi:RNA polymerase sporulation-specific sigma factor
MEAKTETDYGLNAQKRDIELIKQLRQGDNSAMEQLLTLYKGLVRARAATMFIAGADNEDVIQEGMIGLFKAIRSYDPERGLAFSSFAGYCIMSQITDAVRQDSRNKHKPLNDSISLQATISPSEDNGLQWQDLLAAQRYQDPEELLLYREKQQMLQRFIREHLSLFERQVVLLYLQSLSYQQIADFLDCPVKSVDNALGRVRLKMRSYRNKHES